MIDPLNDNISRVELLDYMGSDLSVVNAARVSMAKESAWEFPETEAVDGISDYVTKLPDADTKLIGYLARHGHWTPFSHPQISLRIKMPFALARQWFKHQIGLTRNEISRRYVISTPEVHAPTVWRKAAPSVKQGSMPEPVLMNEEVSRRYEDLMLHSLEFYEFATVDAGVCAEQSRFGLLFGSYTEFIETGSLAAYARLCKLRLDPHAQQEVRHYAQAVSDIIKPMFPVSWEALT